MKRDLELIRKILLTVEDDPHGRAPQEISIEGYTEEQIGYHCYLIVDAGLATGIDCSDLASPSPAWILTILTTEGHDFAEAVRNDTVWNKVRAKIREVGSSIPVELAKQLAAQAVRTMVLTLP